MFKIGIPRLVFEYHSIDEGIDISIVVPIFNQVKIIGEVIQRILRNTVMNFEIILIDDGSTDLTLEAITNFFTPDNIGSFPNLKSIRVYRNRVSKFETHCDHFGISVSRSNYCLEIQADMLLNDPGFDGRMFEAMQLHSDCVAISGRGIEKLGPIVTSYERTLGSDRSSGRTLTSHIILRAGYQIKHCTKRIVVKHKVLHARDAKLAKQVFSGDADAQFLETGCAGRLGMAMEHVVPDHLLNERKLYVGQSIMRGPILFNREWFLEIGGLRPEAYFQGYDDHDFCARTNLKGKFVGYTPVAFTSPLEIGSTRKPRSFSSELLIISNLIRIRKGRSLSALNAQNLAVIDLVHTNSILYF